MTPGNDHSPSKGTVVADQSPDIGLLITGGPHERSFYRVNSFPCKIGRNPDCRISLFNDNWVSGNHAQITYNSGQFFITDLHSTNGTYVNGARVDQPTAIVPNKSTIAMGRTQLILFPREKPKDTDAGKQALRNTLARGSILMNTSGVAHKPQVEETLFVIDVVNSTEYAHHAGEAALVDLIESIAGVITRCPERENINFMKCTGDGFFITMIDTDQALEIGHRLISHLDTKSKTDPGFKHPGIRIGIHRGVVNIDPTGDRLGIPCHLVFRLEGAKVENRVGQDQPGGHLPTRDRILITNEALKNLGESHSRKVQYVGDFLFKGFDKPVAVNIVRNRECE